MDNLPSFSRSRMAKAVNCLEREATWNTVVGLIGAACSRSAEPATTLATILPSIVTDTAAPGASGRAHGWSSVRTADAGSHTMKDGAGGDGACAAGPGAASGHMTCTTAGGEGDVTGKGEQ